MGAQTSDRTRNLFRIPAYRKGTYIRSYLGRSWLTGAHAPMPAIALGKVNNPKLAPATAATAPSPPRRRWMDTSN